MKRLSLALLIEVPVIVAVFATNAPWSAPLFASPTIPIAEYPLNAGYTYPYGIIRGPDNNVWFGEYANPGSAIARITPSGTITDFPVPGPGPGMTAGSDGNIWYVQSGISAVSKMTLVGAVTTYTLPSGSGPVRITAGPDDNLWITDYAGNQILRVTTGGNVTGQFPIPTSNSQPHAITSGSDGNLWFTETHAEKIGRITVTGTVTEFSLPSGLFLCQGDLVSDLNGNLWFCTYQSDAIAYMTPDGTIATIPYQTSYGLSRFTVDASNNVWALSTFCKYLCSGTLYRITPFGFVSPIADVVSSSPSITFGGDGRIWITKYPYSSSPSASILALDPRDVPASHTTTFPIVAR